MRLIDANSLEELIWRSSRRAIQDVIQNAPTIEAERIRHGHWLFYEEPDGYYYTECSECGQKCDEDVFLKGKWNYCPNCGAKMDEVEERREDVRITDNN